MDAALQRAGSREPDGQQQDREREQNVDQARDQRVDRTAVEAGDHAGDHADQHRQRRGHDRHLERHAGAVEHATEDVTAQRVDAEDVVLARARRRAERIEVLGGLRVRRARADELDDQRRADRAQHHEDDEAERCDRYAVFPQPAPKQLQRGTRLDLRGGGRLSAGLAREIDCACQETPSLSFVMPRVPLGAPWLMRCLTISPVLLCSHLQRRRRNGGSARESYTPCRHLRVGSILTLG